MFSERDKARAVMALALSFKEYDGIRRTNENILSDYRSNR